MATAAACAIIILTGPMWWVMIVVGILWFAAAAFFRDPLFRKPATNGPATIVRIFLSVLDVHINRMPCESTVVSMKHTPGQYLDARSEQSARVNESNLIIIKNTSGDRIGVKQISGAIARRIVCPICEGDSFQRGQRFGMIKFGSTTELIIPTRDTNVIRVKKGDRVVGGVTILASFPTLPTAS